MLLILALLFVLWGGLFRSVVNDWFLFLLWGLLNDHLFLFLRLLLWLFGFWLSGWSCLLLASGVLEYCVITVAGVVRRIRRTAFLGWELHAL